MNSKLTKSTLLVLAALCATGCYTLRDRNEQLDAALDPALDAGIEADTEDAADVQRNDGDAMGIPDRIDVTEVRDVILLVDARDAMADSDGARPDAEDALVTDATDASVVDVRDAGSDAPLDVGCPAGTEPLGATCVTPTATPRPISPLSLGETTRRRPSFRWELPSGMDGALLEICRDRACSTVLESRRVLGTSTQANTDLPATSALYWRLRGTSGAATSSRTSPTWLFRTPLLGASGPVNTSATPHLDVNGDGYDDLAIGAPSASPAGRIVAGAVTIYFGSAAGPSPTASQTLEGLAAGDRLGDSVASAGDIDGDGYGDLVVGASMATVTAPVPLSTAGKVYLFRGGPRGLDLAPSLVLNGVAAGDNFGNSVASAGDVNGDGYADVLAGAWLSNMATGAVSVFHGRATGLSSAPAIVLTGPDFFSQFGFSVAHVGDANGDGFSDVAIGAPLSPRIAPSTGRVYVYYGSATGLASAVSRTLSGAAHNDRFGASLAGGFDANNDGYSDTVIGSFRSDPGGVSDVGMATLFLGRTTGYETTPSATIMLPMGSAEDYFGEAVSNLGDVNRDGYDDIAIGALQATRGGRRNTGLVAVFHGNISGIGAAPARVIEGSAAGDALGASIAGIDGNGDGFEDLLVGAPQSLASPTGAGRVSYFAGSTAGITATPARSWTGVSPSDAFATSVGR